MKCAVVALLAFACWRPLPPIQHAEVKCAPCEARADGRHPVHIHVALSGPGGDAVRGVRLNVGSAQTVLSDAEGRARVALRSPVPGHRDVSVCLPDGTCLGWVAVAFTSAPHDSARYSGR